MVFIFVGFYFCFLNIERALESLCYRRLWSTRQVPLFLGLGGDSLSVGAMEVGFPNAILPAHAHLTMLEYNKVLMVGRKVRKLREPS